MESLDIPEVYRIKDPLIDKVHAIQIKMILSDKNLEDLSAVKLQLRPEFFDRLMRYESDARCRETRKLQKPWQDMKEVMGRIHEVPELQCVSSVARGLAPSTSCSEGDGLDIDYVSPINRSRHGYNGLVSIVRG